MSETTTVLLQASVTALGRLVLAALVMFAACLPVQADAIIQNRAMLSSSIAEYFVEEEGVLLELEIGALDLGAFRNLLPDEIYGGLAPACERARLEVRPRWPRRSRCASPQAPVDAAATRAGPPQLVVTFVGGRRCLPVVSLRRAA